MEQEDDYARLLRQIDDLKKLCEKLSLDIAQLEFPIHSMLRAKSEAVEEGSSSDSGT